MDSLKDMALGAVVFLVGIIGYFLRQKDEAQGKQIQTLWTKHDADAKDLADLRERIAREHYVKGELDARFTRLEDAIKTMSSELGAKMDRLTDTLIAALDKKVDRGECERFHSK